MGKKGKGRKNSINTGGTTNDSNDNFGAAFFLFVLLQNIRSLFIDFRLRIYTRSAHNETIHSPRQCTGPT